MPRSSVVPVADLKAAIVKEKNRIIQENGRIALKSDQVWQDLSSSVGNKTTPANFYTVVRGNRHNIWNDLSYNPTDNTSKDDDVQVPATVDSRCLNRFGPPESEYSLSSDLTDSEQRAGTENAKRIEFTITLSAEEWESISPLQVLYKYKEKKDPSRIRRSYNILAPGLWTDLINSHFWEHTSLPCALTFKRAKVSPSGRDYVRIFARCKECESEFYGRIQHEPKKNSRAHVICTFSGNFSIHHSGKTKRSFRNAARKFAAEKMNNQNISPSMFRRTGAVHLMNSGDNEPAHLPSLNVLRVAKYEDKCKDRLHSDPVFSLFLLKYSSPYSNYIRDIGYDKFFVHYYSSTQMLVYRAYCQKNEFSKVSIDATGGLVQRISRPNGNKSGHIFLYQVVVHDTVGNLQYSVSNMLSERQDNVSIFYWLAMWVKRGAPIPKEAVTDMSIAILSAVVRAFTECSSLNQYLEVCFSICTQREGFRVPSCFTRCDTAHTLKLVSSWPVLRGKNKRIREFYIRAIAQIISSSDITDTKKILSAILTVALSETEGNLPSGEATQCDRSKSFLKERIATGYDSPQEESTDEQESAQINGEQDDEGDRSSPFEKWFSEIVNQCKKDLVSQDGDRDNLQFLPDIVTALNSLVKLLPLWSGIMIPFFGYGGTSASSAPSESNFNDLKTRVLGNKILPIRVDELLQTHLISEEGTILLISAHSRKKGNSNKQSFQSNQSTIPDFSHLPPRKRKSTYQEFLQSEKPDAPVTQIPTCPACSAGNLPTGAHVCTFCKKHVHIFDECSLPLANTEEGYGQQRICFNCSVKEFTHVDVSLHQKGIPTTHVDAQKNCPACLAGNLPTGAHVCTFCKLPVHIFDECSLPLDNTEEGYGQKRVCYNCNKKKSTHEDAVLENWKGLAELHEKKQKKPSKYLGPHPDYRFVDFRSKSKRNPIGLLRNGGSLPDQGSQLKTRLKNESISLTNTCSFDSLVQVLCSSYSDSVNYKAFVDSGAGELLFQLVQSVVNCGVTSRSYKLRAEILMNIFQARQLPSGVKVISTESTISWICSKVLSNFPSLITTSECPTRDCLRRYSEHSTTVLGMTFTSAEDIRSVQIKINELFTPRKEYCTVCKCEKSVTMKVPCSHVFLETLLLSPTSDLQTDIAPEMQVELNVIPDRINVSGKDFALRGVVGFFGGSKLITSIGHYVAFCKRIDNVWELYDDTSPKKSPCSRTSRQNCQLLIYSE